MFPREAHESSWMTREIPKGPQREPKRPKRSQGGGSRSSKHEQSRFLEIVKKPLVFIVKMDTWWSIIYDFGPMMRHVGPIWAIFGQLGGMRGQHGMIMVHVGSSLGLWGEKVGILRVPLNLAKTMNALKSEQLWIWGVPERLGRGKPLPWG